MKRLDGWDSESLEVQLSSFSGVRVPVVHWGAAALVTLPAKRLFEMGEKKRVSGTRDHFIVNHASILVSVLSVTLK